MKFLSTLIIGIMLIPNFAFAEVDHAELQAPKVVLEHMQESYGATICDSANDEEWELLGESFMQDMAGSDERHEWMDSMHGGEGSKELLAFHIDLGKNYAECESSSNYFRGGMMGGSTNTWGNFSGMHGMMTGNAWGKSKSFSGYSDDNLGFGFPIFFMTFHIIMWFVVLALSVFVTRKVWDASASKKK